jgi:hypothetical protein
VIRLAISRGTWQSLMLSAALAEHRLRGEPDMPLVLVHGGKRVTPALRTALARLGEQTERVERAVWMDDLTAALIHVDIPDAELEVRVEELRRRIGSEPAEIWTSTPRARQNWLVHRAFPKARTIAYEDGLLMYRPSGRLVRPSYERRTRFLRRRVYGNVQAKLFRALRSELGAKAWSRFGGAVGYERTVMRAWRAGVPGYTLPDPVAAYLVLPRLLEPNPFYGRIAREIRPQVVRDVLAAYARDLVDDRDGLPRPRALVLSQQFSSVAARSEDVAVYADAIRKLSAAGFSVYWKDHPWTHEPILPLLQRALEPIPVHTLPIDPTLPVELALVHHPVDLVVSAWSSSLFYVKHLWGTEAARVVPPPDPRPYHGRHLLTELVREHVPDLDRWLAERKPA